VKHCASCYKADTVSFRGAVGFHSALKFCSFGGALRLCALALRSRIRRMLRVSVTNASLFTRHAAVLDLVLGSRSLQIVLVSK